MRDFKTRPNFLEMQCIEARRSGAWHGVGIGAAIGIVLMIFIHQTLAAWSDHKHEQAMLALKAADKTLLDECKGIVRDLAEEEYEVVVNYRREIDRLQRNVRQ